MEDGGWAIMPLSSTPTGRPRDSTRVLVHTAAKPPDVMRKVMGVAVGIKPNTRIELGPRRPETTDRVLRTRPRRSLGN
jgi:hypothetical protein